jgi:anti-sigma B factor antagonist
MTALSGQRLMLGSLSSRDRDGVVVVSLRGELDICGSSALQAYFSELGRQTRPRGVVADLTGLAFIDCGCLTVLVRHCQDIKSDGGSFALAGPHGAVHRILAVTGLLNWFDVDDTVEEAVSRTAIKRPPVLPIHRLSGVAASRAESPEKATNAVSILKKFRHKALTAAGKPGRTPAGSPEPASSELKDAAIM